MAYEAYVDKAMYIMKSEFDEYEKQFEQILHKVGINNDIWEASRGCYIQSENDESTNGLASGGHTIESIDKRVYEFLPQPNVPKSLTKEKTKQVMIDVNYRAAQVFKYHLRDNLGDYCPPEYEPLLMETLAFDFASLEYNYGENVFRYAIHKYELSKDAEIKEQLEEYLSS
jgi:hypothetical protein